MAASETKEGEALAAKVAEMTSRRFGESTDPTFRSMNFSAGPGTLPTHVIKELQADLLNYRGTGMSFGEISHRDVDGPVQSRMTEVVDLLRLALTVPENYHILFFAGGANAQFAMVPMNLLGDATKADYVSNGYWSDRAANEAKKYCDVAAPVSSTTTLPPASEWSIRPDAAYVHVCLNETIAGLEYVEDPDLPAGSPPLVADATSMLLQRPMDVSKYGMIYASAGKNLGMAGVCVVIVRDDLLKRPAHPHLPAVFDYRLQATTSPIPSIVNTPPTQNIHIVGLMLADVLRRGGLEEMDRIAKANSAKIYKIIDESDGFYTNTIDKAFRSRINVPFRVRDGDRELETEFHTVASKEHGMHQLFGHPVLGGLRVTMYNSITTEAVDKVAEYMKSFMAKHAA